MQEATAESVTHAHGVAIPTRDTVIRTNDVRETAAQKFEELARKLRSGELNGARCEWNDDEDMPAMVVVEVAPFAPCEPFELNGKTMTKTRTATLIRYTFDVVAKALRSV